jgi:hypothetical protein
MNCGRLPGGMRNIAQWMEGRDWMSSSTYSREDLLRDDWFRRVSFREVARRLLSVSIETGHSLVIVALNRLRHSPQLDLS